MAFSGAAVLQKFWIISAESSALLALERRFGRPDGVKLALEQRFGRPDGVKLALEWRYGRPAGAKLALERRFGGPRSQKTPSGVLRRPEA